MTCAALRWGAVLCKGGPVTVEYGTKQAFAQNFLDACVLTNITVRDDPNTGLAQDHLALAANRRNIKNGIRQDAFTAYLTNNNYYPRSNIQLLPGATVIKIITSTLPGTTGSVLFCAVHW